MNSTFVIAIGILLGIYLIYKMFANPVIGVAAVLLANPFEPFMPELGGFTLGRMMGVISILAWFNHITRRNKNLIKVNHKLYRSIIYFLVAIFLSAFVWLVSDNSSQSMVYAFTILLLSLMALMIDDLATDKKKVQIIVVSMALAGALISLPAFLYGIGIDIYTPLGAPTPTDTSEETLRASNIGGNPNSLGIKARNSIFASFLLLTLVKSKLWKGISIAILGVSFIGLSLSGSRTNFYGTVIIFVVFALLNFKWIFGKNIRLVGLVVGGSLLIYIALQLVPEGVQKRLLFGGGDATIAKRTESRENFTSDQQAQAVSFVIDHPFFGIGLDRTESNSENNYGAHDTISVVLGEIGLIGFFTFLGLLFYAFSKMFRMYQRKFLKNQGMQIGLLVGMLVSMIIMGYKGGYIIPYDRSFWIVLGLIEPVRRIWYQDWLKRYGALEQINKQQTVDLTN
ncbi:MAG: hypothetical protein GC181_03630 [Bacteroidetes bacterium]|nr:hypothetical protein [Bacteroidota bacterium]